MKKLTTPLSDEDVSSLNIGDTVYISGFIYTARDQAHKRLIEEECPFDLNGSVLFHAGPIVEKINDDKYKMVAIGPTTSMRMNPYQSDVIKMGVKGIIGKGGMDDNTLSSLKSENSVYLAATGGCAALYVSAVEEIAEVYFLDLGVPEAIWKLKVNNFGPLIVAMDSKGNSIFKQ